MRKALYTLLLILLSMLSCTKPVDLKEYSGAGARCASLHFYDLLARGKAQEYVDNMYEAHAMDSSQYAQYVDMMEQFLHEQRLSTDGGILSVRAERDTLSDSLALVFLDVLFADSTTEEVMLPLVYSQGRWWIK